LIAEVAAATLVGVIARAGGTRTRWCARPVLLCVLAAGGAIALAACGSDSSDTASPTTTPSTVAPTTTTAGPVTYQVTRGDTLTSIAAFFGLSNATLAEANQLGSQDQLTEGQVLVIPPIPPPQLTITPDGGHAGETFTLTLTGAKAGETITFEIDGPGPGTFTGSPHNASQEGAVTARYSSSGDDPGKYTVVASGDRGTSLTASYRLLE